MSNDEWFWVPRFPRGADVSDPSENRQQDFLAESLKELRLTPVLGAECSVIDRKETRSWARIAHGMQRVAASFDDNPPQLYLESLGGEQKVPSSPPPIDGRDQQHVSLKASPWNEMLDAFRKAVALLASSAGKAFGTAMVGYAPAVTDTAGYEAKITDSLDVRNLKERLLEVWVRASILHELKRRENVQTIFDTEHVTARLGELVRSIVGTRLLQASHDKLARQLRDPFTRALSGLSLSFTQEDQGPVHLLFQHLEWIAYLLWYSFYADQQSYPTESELAFQVSLGIKEAVSHRRDSFATAAETVGSEVVPQEVQKWFRSYSPPEDERPPAMREFYDQVACLLQAQQRNTENRSEEDWLGGVAFSLTFDLEMEAALHRLKAFPYCVAMPLRYRRRGLGRHAETQHYLRWALARFDQGSSLDKTDDWQWFPDESSGCLPEIKGPLLVRLHGSPLHELPPETDPMFERPDGGWYQGRDHALVLSETDFLYNVALLQSLPKFLTRVLEDESRHFYFLGAAISEWNIRLRMFGHVFPGMNKEAGRARDRKMVAISSHLDPQQSSMLAALGFERWKGPVEILTPAIQRYVRC